MVSRQIGTTRGTRPTKLMKRVAAQHDGRPIIDVIVEGVNNKGLSETAAELGISKASLGYWILKLGIRVERTALRPNERIEVVRSS